MTGEIAIRNHYHGETAFYALESYDEQTMRSVIAAAFLDGATTSAICGWLDCESDNQFEANLGIFTKE